MDDLTLQDGGACAMIALVKSTRRRFFGLMGATPLAAKAAADAEVKQLMGLNYADGLGQAGLNLTYGLSAPSNVKELPWAEKTIRLAKHISLFGIPKFVEKRFREESKNIHSLDPDIANKRSWSMAVKVMTQRERNYQRKVEQLLAESDAAKGRQVLGKLLGFEWPW